MSSGSNYPTGTGSSFMDQYNSAQAGLNALNNTVDGTNFSQDEWQAAKSMLGAQKGQAAIGAGLAGLQGLTSIAGIASGMANIADTSQYQQGISGINRIGSTNYNSFDQISTDFGVLNTGHQNFDYDTIRGGSTAERVGGTLSSGLSGALTGLQIGGPWGALIGGVVGLGAGAIGWAEGDSKADAEKIRLTAEQKVAENRAIKNLNSQSSQISDYQFRSGISNRVANGGQIERKSQTLQEFANEVLRNKPTAATHKSGIIRQHCKGGTMIRIKR